MDGCVIIQLSGMAHIVHVAVRPSTSVIYYLFVRINLQVTVAGGRFGSLG